MEEANQKPGDKKRRLPLNLRENRATAFSNDPEARAKALLGATGETETFLKPMGGVRIDGAIHDAISEGGFLDPGEPVHVVGFHDFKLVVRKTE